MLQESARIIDLAIIVFELWSSKYGNLTERTSWKTAPGAILGPKTDDTEEVLYLLW